MLFRALNMSKHLKYIVFMKKSKHIVALLLALCLFSTMKAQIAITPSFVFVDEKNGIGNVFISNNAETSYEVSIDFTFGYPGSDTVGNLVMNYGDSLAYAKYALDPMLRAFPRSFILKGGQQRTVRLQVIPKLNNKDGFYYTRMKVLAKPMTADVTDSVAQGIGTKINFFFEQRTAVFYHKGKVSTGLEVKELDILQNEKILELRPHLACTGNAPFLGSMFAKLRNSEGKVVSETESTTTVYFDAIRRMDLKLEEVPPGTYSLELSFETRRNDMQSSDLIQAPRLVQNRTVVIK